MASAQKVSLGTDAIQWANFGTVNIDLGVSVHQHSLFLLEDDLIHGSLDEMM